MTYDLILKGGRVIDPSQEVDGVCDVAFGDGKVVAVGAGLDATGCPDVRDVSGKIVTPGIIDLHTHVYWGGNANGVVAEDLARKSGVTTFVDTGSSGPGNFLGFRKHVIEPSPVRILAYLHISFGGITGYSNLGTVVVGESENMRLMAPIDSVKVIDENRDLIVGMKVRVGRTSSGASGINPVYAARMAAEEAGVPMMVHIDEPPPSYEEVLDLLRPGDILTHAFRPFPNVPTTRDGKVKQAVLDARARGVIFDIGHGKASLSFATTRTMLANGFLPDTISSDIYTMCIDGPVYDQLTTLSKFLCLGMSLHDVIAATTVNPAAALQRPDLGTFKPGSTGDASILSLKDGSYEYVDVVGEVLTGDRKLFCEGVVIDGKWWFPG